MVGTFGAIDTYFFNLNIRGGVLTTSFDDIHTFIKTKQNPLATKSSDEMMWVV